MIRIGMEQNSFHTLVLERYTKSLVSSMCRFLSTRAVQSWRDSLKCNGSKMYHSKSRNVVISELKG